MKTKINLITIFHIILFIQLVASTSMPYTAIAAVRIVEKNRPQASIVIDSNASEQIHLAAKTLQEYIQKASHAQIPIKKVNEISSVESRAYIWIGPCKLSAKLKSVLQRMDNDGFVISFPSSKDILIIGPTDWGTEFGVYEFLEKYLGIRWLLPGPDGEHIPITGTIDIPIQEIKQEPVFFSREISGLRGSEQIKWARHNRMHGRLKFHHNLNNLFPPERYNKSHPEFFPVHRHLPFTEGERYLPQNSKIVGWQPCFTAPGIVEEAVKNICNYFDRYPEEVTYSLGVNDSGGHCECEQCQKKDSGKINFVGRRDISDRYFEWANAVVKGVLENHPDKWFGCLAYSEIAEPPTKVKINPRIVPYLAYDRMKWVNKDIELEGYEITKRWALEALTTGWYDYIYGTPYMLPRVYFDKSADYYRYAATNRVKAMYAEAYPNWGEGPKLYMVLKLFWDPEQEVTKLLNDWYIRAVGEKAAPYLATYYKLWENFWTNRVPEGNWFKKGSTYLSFYSPNYLDEVAFDDMKKSRNLLESVANFAHSKKQKKRAEYLLKSFEYYEASALSYLGLRRGMRQPGEGIEYYQSLNKRRYKLINEFQKDFLLIHPIRFDELVRFEKFLW